MKAIVLAGGFAKRLYPISDFTPKPLLPVAGKPILHYILEKEETVSDIDTVYISTNVRFERHFTNSLKYFNTRKNLKLVVENTKNEDEKLGAIGAIAYIIQKEKIDDDLLVVAGDNLFDFELTEFVDFFKEKKCSIVAFYDIEKKIPERYGIGCLDDNCKVIDFREKPKNPKSTLISTACYLFPKRTLKRFREYIDGAKNPDAPGFFLEWLFNKEDLYGYRFSGKWFDIGNMDSYKEAAIEYERRLMGSG